jgi:acetylornithine deacetylase/succinyl-diaminopimelate desuccinylase-like protein
MTGKGSGCAILRLTSLEKFMSANAPNTGPLSREAVLDVLSLLIRTPSVNPTLAPEEPGGEAPIAAVARDWLAAQGVESWLEEAAPGRPNAVARLGRGNGPSLVFCAHVDTVWTSGMTIPPFEPRVEGNRVYGRGSYDMKGGAAAILSAVAQIAQEPPRAGTLLVALVADEEYASLGAQHFVAHHKADACVVTEPSEGKLILAHKGFVWARISTAGRAAHGSRWDLGVSAVARMGRVIAALDDFDRRVLRPRVHPLVGSASQHCATVHGGAGLSTYAPACTLEIERRTLPGETPAQVLEELRTVVAESGEEAEIELILDRPPLVCPRDARIASAVRESAARICGSEPEEAGVGYWMDAALFAAAGMETVNYGATGAGAHENVEWADLDSVVRCAGVLAETARRFCA